MRIYGNVNVIAETYSMQKDIGLQIVRLKVVVVLRKCSEKKIWKKHEIN